MMTNDGRSAIEAWAVEERERLGGPPTPEEVVAYLRGELDQENAARVQALLVYYPELTPLLSERAAVVERAAVPLKRRVPWRLLAIAATVIIALQTVLLIQSRLQLAENRRPHVHETRHELDNPLRRGPGAAPPRRELPAGEKHYLIAVKLAERPNDRQFRIDLVDVSSAVRKTVWSESGVHPDEQTFNVTIPGQYLPPGSYTIDVYALGEGRPLLLERFPFDVKHE